MAILNKDTAADNMPDVMPEHLRTMTSEMQTHALRRIVLRSNDIHQRLVEALGDWKTNDVMGLLRSGKDAFTKDEEALLREVIQSIPAKELNELRLGAPEKITCNGLEVMNGMMPAPGSIEFETKHYLNRTPAEVRAMLNTGLTGIVVTPAGSTLVTGTQLDAAAAAISAAIAPFTHLDSLRATFAGGDAKSLNVQTALAFSGQLTEAELEKALNPDAGLDAEIKKLSAKSTLFNALNDLKNFSNISDAVPDTAEAVDDEIDLVDTDLAVVRSGAAGVATCAALAGETIPLANTAVNQAARQEMKAALSNEHKRLKSLKSQYKKIGDKLLSMYQFATDAGETSPLFATFIDVAATPPTIKLNALKSDMKLDQLVVTFMTDLKMKDGGYAEELKEKKAKKPQQLTGAKAVLAVYKAYIKKTKPTASDHEVEQVANMLFSENNIDNGFVREVRSVIEDVMLDMGKEERGYVGLKEAFTQMFYGSERAFVKNLKHAAHIRGNLNEQTPRKLMTYFFSLRESVRESHLAHNDTFSNFVREEMVTVGQVLARKSMTQSWNDAFKLEGEKDEHGHEKKIDVPAKMMNLNGDVTNLLTMPINELPQPYQDSVKRAMEYAVKHTGSTRRAIGRGIATGAGYGKEGVVAVAKAPLALGEQLVAPPLAVIGGIKNATRSALGGIFDFMTEKKAFGSV